MCSLTLTVITTLYGLRKTIYEHPLLAVLIEVNTQNILDISQAQTLCRSTLGVIKRFQYVYKTTNRRVPRHVLL